jgi:arginine decarboxylase
METNGGKKSNPPGQMSVEGEKTLDVYVPKRIFFTKGVGIHKEELHSFELALRDAGIEKCNLVQVSSILPPGCQVISKASVVFR